MADRVIVVGAGINGASAAFFLAERGAEVVLLERDYPAAGPTGSSSAITHTFYLEPELSQLAHRGVQLLRHLPEIADGPSDYREVGMMWVVGAAAADEWTSAVDRIRGEGAKIETVNVDVLRSSAPHFDFDGVALGVWEPEGGYADPATSTSTLVAGAVARGAVVRAKTSVAELRSSHGRVIGVRTDSGETIDADAVVLAVGPWSRPLVQQVGVDLPLTVERHPMAVLDTPQRARQFMPWSWCDDTLSNYARPEGDSLVLVGEWAGGGTGHRHPDAERGREVDPTSMRSNRSVDDVESAEIVATFEPRIPTITDLKIRPGYADLYDMSPDDLPVIGAVPGSDGLFVVAGSSGHGFKTGPAVGEAVAELVVSGSHPLLRPFSVDRFFDN